MNDNAKNTVPLGWAVKAAAGYPIRGALDELPSGDVHLLQLKHMSLDHDVDWSSVPTVSLPSKREPVWLSDNDVIFAPRGTRTLAYPLTNTPAKAVCAPQFFALSVDDPGRLLPEFLAWQINQRPAQDYLQRNATGSYIQNIRREVLENLPITIPPLHDQRLIVDFWRAAQRERAMLQQLIENRNNQLEALALRLLQHTSGEIQ